MSEIIQPPEVTGGVPEAFSEPTRSWFDQAFAGPTRVQSMGWPALAAGRHGLLVAPTGSGKTLAAFLWGIDRCLRLPTDAEPGVRVLYVSPLKALVYDIERNLRAPLVGIRRTAERLGTTTRDVRVDMRTGDTPSRDRARQRRNPADILVTTPESLFLLLGSQAAATLTSVHSVIVDEIHVFASTKRGVHLALSLERLAELVRRRRQEEDGEDGVEPKEPQRIGLSATVRPLDAVARFLGGVGRDVEIVDAAERSHLELRVVVPVPDMEDPSRTVPDADENADVDAGSPDDDFVEGSVLGDLRRRDELRAAASSGGASGGMGQQGNWRSSEGGIWPSIYPRLIDLILEHRSTIVFTNSRGLCERLAQRLNEMHAERWWEENATELEEGQEPAEAPELVRTHHGSISHEQRREVEEALKGGQLRCIVATSSLELGIDMGTVDLVILVESPGSVARGLQRVGRAGHGVGELSRGVVFPKFKGDLLECAVVTSRMLEGTLEPLHLQQNPLDVLAQQVVSMVADRDRTPDEIETMVRRAAPYADLSREALESVLDMLSGRYPSDDFSDLRPRLAWDRAAGVLSARRGAKQVALMNAGTIPDRGLYSVVLGEDGPRLGELDEEMVYESRAGDVILLGATAWRVVDITRDRVIVQPAPGEPGRMPFWHGDGPGRPIELGRAVGAFLAEAEARLRSEDDDAVVAWLRDVAPLDELAARNLVGYLRNQVDDTGRLPTHETLVIERFRDELGDWRVCLLTPFGSRVHAPWAMALQRRLGEMAGFEIETMYTDDGVVLRFPDLDELPPVEDFLPESHEVEDLVVDQVGSSALFATRFRENAARSLLTPKRRGGERQPLWLQRLRSKSLLAAVRRFANFPILLETYRECLQDVFDLPALKDVLSRIEQRTVRVHEVETASASPFARSLVYAYIAQYLYEQDAPLAERKAQALTLDRNLLRELLGQAELRELLDPDALDAVEAELQCTAEDRRARDADEVHDLLRRLGDLSVTEVAQRLQVPIVGDAASPEETGNDGREEAAGGETLGSDQPSEESVALAGQWLDDLRGQARAGVVRIGGQERWIAAEDAARYRDALGCQPPAGLPQTFLDGVEDPLTSLLERFARTHGPFTTEQIAQRFHLLPAQVEPILRAGTERGALLRGEIRPGGAHREWCDQSVLRRIKRRTLAKLRGEVAAVDASVLGRFLPRWHGLEPLPEPEQPGARKRRPAAVGAGAASQRLAEVVAQIEGLPLPWSVLVGDVLPARIPGFDLELLDLAAASGEIVWVGAGALGAKDGRITLFRREQADRLIRPRWAEDLWSVMEFDGEPPDLDARREIGERIGLEEPTLLHLDVLAHLHRRGATFAFELQRLEGAREAASAELDAVVWDLAWAGLITNDTFLPLRALAAPRTRGRRTPRRPPAAARGRMTAPRPVRGAAGPLGGGRWSLVDDLLFEPGTDTEWAAAKAGSLLERYGLVSREAALAENVPGGFESVYPVLREMEDRGQVRRGYFVEGLSGRQFATAGAVERLRAERSELDEVSGEDETVFVLPAVDPAQPYGALLSWPERTREDGPNARRVKGAWVVLAGGEAVGFLESSARSVVTFQRTAKRGAVDALARGLAEICRRARRRSLRLLRIDGEPASTSRWADGLVRCGWQLEGEALVFRRDA